mmetsp:Transcript_31726/g.82117  ORF Transcript_31726/g.82117 Transcript_31726/m.82117 type:complete len:241 (+) Transcript_31726:948-1670(+)
MSAGAVGCWVLASGSHLRSRAEDMVGRPGRPGRLPKAAWWVSKNMDLSGAKLTMPSWRLRSRMAVSNAPAATCSPARLHFCCQRCWGGTPGVGATNCDLPVPVKLSSAPTSVGRSRSSISQPPSSSLPLGKPSASSMPRPSSSSAASPSPPRSRSSSSPQPAPAASISSAPSAPMPASCPLANAPSKKPLETVSSGQLSSLRMGVGGISSDAAGDTSGTLSKPSARRAASSARPCAAAVV